MKKILSHITKYVLPMMLGIGIFWLLYRQFDWKEILYILSQDMNYFLIIVSMLVGVISHITRALRWQLQLRTLDIRPSLGTLCNAIFGTYAFNLVLPRFGELWRCTYMANHEKASFSRVFGSMLSDRVVDGITAITIVGIVFLSQMGIAATFLGQNPNMQQNIQSILTSPWLYIALAALAGALYYIFKHKSNNKFVKRIRETLRKMAEGFNSVLSMKSGKFLFLL
ncbi:MAG: flippase-like domain-containing protein [Muribaculaceae bacterium]|nr:flippase-like domain-containing protein [Muribaculaceae bacterium]